MWLCTVMVAARPTSATLAMVPSCREQGGQGTENVVEQCSALVSDQGHTAHNRLLSHVSATGDYFSSQQQPHEQAQDRASSALWQKQHVQMWQVYDTSRGMPHNKSSNLLLSASCKSSRARPPPHTPAAPNTRTCGDTSEAGSRAASAKWLLL